MLKMYRARLVLKKFKQNIQIVVKYTNLNLNLLVSSAVFSLAPSAVQQ